MTIRKGKDGKESCRCSDLLSLTNITTEDVRGDQNHTPNSTKYKAEKIVASMKNRAKEEVESVSRIYMDTLKDIVYCCTLNYYKY